MYAASINAAIAAGQTVTAVAADIERRGQPRRGQTVELTQAWDSRGEIRATARGFTGRFGVDSDSVTISGTCGHDVRAEASH